MKKQMVLFAALMTMFVSNAQAVQYVPNQKDDPAMSYIRQQADRVATGTSSCPFANKNASGNLNDEPARVVEASNVPAKTIRNGLTHE